MKKMLFVMNPYAGQRKANRHLPDIISLFNRAGFEVTTHMTACTGDAAKIVESKAAGMDLVVCCGGDGTLNETVSGVLRAGADVPIGYIPAGSTNDFAASLKMSLNPLQAAKDIIEGACVSYDVGSFGDRYFAYVASFGAFTRASYATPQNIKNALGHMAYVLEGINELSQLRPLHVRMEMDDLIVEDDFLFGAISNSTSVGGILTLDPKQVDMGDGLFEVMLFRSPKNLLELSQCIQAVKAQRYNDCQVITFCPTHRVKIIADPEMPWTLDGERYKGNGEMVVENLHHAVRLVQRVNKDA